VEETSLKDWQHLHYNKDHYTLDDIRCNMTENDPYKRSYYPLLIVISGPSGVGKDTIAHMMLENYDTFHFVVTATTRPARS